MCKLGGGQVNKKDLALKTKPLASCVPRIFSNIGCSGHRCSISTLFWVVFVSILQFYEIFSTAKSYHIPSYSSGMALQTYNITIKVPMHFSHMRIMRRYIRSRLFFYAHMRIISAYATICQSRIRQRMNKIFAG